MTCSWTLATRSHGDGGSGASAGTRSSTRSQDASNARASERSFFGSTPAACSSRIVRSSARVLEEVVEHAGPASVERHRRGHLVEHLHLRRELRLHRVLGEEPLGEGVQRADGGAVELRQRHPAALRLRHRRGGSGLTLLERPAHTVAELGAGLLGEGDGGQVAQLHLARGDQRDHSAHRARWSCRSRRRPPRTGWCRGRARCDRGRPGRGAWRSCRLGLRAARPGRRSEPGPGRSACGPTACGARRCRARRGCRRGTRSRSRSTAPRGEARTRRSRCR